MSALPPGPRTPPLWQMLRWIRQPLPFMHECVERYGDCFTLRWPSLPPVVFFTDPETIKQIFTGDPEEFRAGQANMILQPVLGDNSVLLLDGARHHRERRLLMPPFHGERMRLYGDVMRDITDRAIDAWPTGRPFPIHERMQGITLDVILRTVFGMDEGPKLARLRSLLIAFLKSATSNPLTMISWLQVDLGPLTPWHRTVELARQVNELLFEQISRRRAATQNGRQDILSMLVQARHEDGESMTDQELRDEMITMLLAGHETTATSLAWVFSHLLTHPPVLERALAECRQVIGSGPVAPDRVNELSYLDAVIKETLRLNPIVPIVGRRLNNPTRLGDYDLPAPVTAAPCIYLTHRRPDLWPEPDRFEPERFLDRRVSPYAFFPFGGGVRHCLGAAFADYEMKIVLGEVLSRVSLRAVPGHTTRVVRRGITFAPSEGMPVICEKPAG